jgi:hypothetical protein
MKDSMKGSAYQYLNLVAAAAALGLGLGVAGHAQAIPLSVLFDGNSIVVDDKLFHGWGLESDISSVPIDYSLIDVTGLPDDPNTHDPDPGLKFTASGGALTVDSGNFIDFGFNFLVTVLKPGLVCDGTPPSHGCIKDASLALTAFSFGPGSDGLIQIEDTVFTADFQQILGDLFVEADPLFGDSLTDAIGFAPQPAVLQEINILVDSGFSGTEAALTMFEVRKSQVPEPATLALLGLGALGLGWCRRRHPASRAS